MGSEPLGETVSIRVGISLIIISVALTMDETLIDTTRQQQNMWVTWANRTNTSAFCLSMASVTDPFRTCLIGIPSLEPKRFLGYLNNSSLANQTILRQEGEKLSTSDDWCHRNHTACQQPRVNKQV